MIPFSNNKYQLIYADPPWSYNDKSLHRGGAERHYSTMKLGDIQQLPIRDICEDNCILFMWGTWPLLEDCINTIQFWGFEYKTIGFIWIKTNKDESVYKGMGHYTRSNSEFCLIGKKGKGLKRIDKSVSSVIISPRRKHSQKPVEAYERIEKLYGNVNKIELFARNTRDNWDSWGLEV